MRDMSAGPLFRKGESMQLTPTERRHAMCDGCPFNASRVWPPVDRDTRITIAQRIKGGEKWVCHQTCDGALVTSSSLLCAGAPHLGGSG
jgi:hypothetical protein